MKAQGLTKMLSLIFLFSAGITVNGQNQQQVPGDDFSLEGALQLFKKSASPEEFERLLNSADSRVNNLDLNGDGDIDYIRVIDRNDANVHAFVLQAVVSPTETQDVAVIELEKLADGKAVLQITGDEDIYGVETIIEPTTEVRVNAGTSTSRSVVNVWAWPSVQYIYGPYYAGWASPWAWGYRPYWWHPWRPVAYYQYYSWWTPYRPYYSYCYSHRIYYAQRLYRPYRSTSVVVYNRHHTQIDHYRSARNDQHNGRDRYDGHSGVRQYGSSGTYDANGRLATSTHQNRDSRSDINKWSQQAKSDHNERSSNYSGQVSKRDSYSNANRSASDIHSSPSNSQRSTSGYQRRESQKWSGTSGSSSGSRQQMPRSSASTSTARSFGSAPIQRSRVDTSGSTHIQRSSGGNSQAQRSSIGTSGTPHVQRSAGASSSHSSTPHSGSGGAGNSSGAHHGGRH